MLNYIGQKNHKKWLDSQMQPPPSRAEFGLPEKLVIPKDQLLTIQAIFSKTIDTWNCDFEPFSDPQKVYLQNKVSKILAEMNILKDDQWMLAARKHGINENFILLLQKEKAYQNLHTDYKNYLDWKKNRNPERAKLEAKVGYDAKNAMTLIRLLKVGKEALLTGKIKVKRTEDREELLSIKNCQWSYDQVIEYADKIEAEMKEAYFNSPLPIKSDINYLDNLCISLIEKSFTT